MSGFSFWFRSILGYEPFPYQKALAERSDLPDVIEGPTGIGKTAAVVMSWLWRKLLADARIKASTPTRLVIVEPQRTLTEQVYRDVKTWCNRVAKQYGYTVDVQLMEGGAINREWVKKPDSPTIIIGTQDQVLSRCLFRGYGESRFAWPMSFAFLNNDCLFVYDEVQLMGVGFPTSAQLQGLRKRFGTYGSTHSIWMSATLNREQLHTVDHDASNLKVHGLSDADEKHGLLQQRLNANKPLRKANTVLGEDADKRYFKNLATEVLSAHFAGTLTIVICNQVERAQELYKEISKCTKEDTHLVHSRFRPSERYELNKLIQERKLTGIVIATQALEAGVDVSARVLFTELSIWSSFVQRVGRCNRDGKETDAVVYWIDISLSKRNISLPYSVEDLTQSRQILSELRDVGIKHLQDVKAPANTIDGLQPRETDILELFDTTPDLSGSDIDVSLFIRETDDTDVAVAWRDFEDAAARNLVKTGQPSVEGSVGDIEKHVVKGCPVFTWKFPTPVNKLKESLPTASELCRVNCWKLKSFLLKQKQSAYVLHPVQGWTKTNRIYPGQTILLPQSVGGYDQKLGYTGKPKDIPRIIDRAGTGNIIPELFEQDPWTFYPNKPVRLDQHSQDVVTQMTKLLKELKHLYLPEEDLITAARWHDLGKSFFSFQEMLRGDDDSRNGTLWAKSDSNGRMLDERKGFRHELLSALVALRRGKSFRQAYLIAAHHGKVRMSLQPRDSDIRCMNELQKKTGSNNIRVSYGVRDGDETPEVDLGAGVTVAPTTVDLDLIELGSDSWTEQAQQLLRDIGPFRLAFLEALIRVADQTASAIDA